MLLIFLNIERYSYQKEYEDAKKLLHQKYIPSSYSYEHDLEKIHNKQLDVLMNSINWTIRNDI